MCVYVYVCMSVGACSMACLWKSEHSFGSRSLFSTSVLFLPLCLCSLLASLSFRFLADAPVSTSNTTRGMLEFWLFATISDFYMGLGDWTSCCQTCTASVFAHFFNLVTYWSTQNWFHMVATVINALMIKTMKCLVNVLTDGLLHQMAILY